MTTRFTGLEKRDIPPANNAAESGKINCGAASPPSDDLNGPVTCTLAEGHDGAHVAHGYSRNGLEPIAVYDADGIRVY